MNKYLLGLFLSVLCFGWGSFAQAESSPLDGRILLDVDRQGEAWYVMPKTHKRYFLGRPEDAWQIMRSLSLGVSRETLLRIPRPLERAVDTELVDRLRGMFLLDVEGRGEVWYVDPVEGTRQFLGKPAEAFALMQQKALGVRTTDLAPIDKGKVVHPLIEVTVPFVAQAPFGEWSDVRQGEGCEEASALMAYAWIQGDESIPLTQARDSILQQAYYEQQMFGDFIDTSVADTAERLLYGYFGLTSYVVKESISVQDIADALSSTSVVITAVNGQALHNPHFTGAGPVEHMVLITGYDPFGDTFIVHDPGTRQGAYTRYSASVLADALMDYPSGKHERLTPGVAAMIVISKESE